jgi:hypothetical protein
MKSMGIIATSALTIIGACVVVVGLRSLPDIKRYLEMRRM